MIGIRGVILHDSVCSEIHESGYDFFICRDGTVIPTDQFTEDDYLHVVLEGDFHSQQQDLGVVHEQIFVLVKLILKLANAFEMIPDDIAAHHDTCPGPEFPWHELSIRMDKPPH